jgi:glycosyltransferase involved in cell wall biosynthesis
MMKRLALRRNVDLFISPSAFARQLHQQNGVVGKEKCRVVPLCIQTNGTGPCLQQNVSRGGEEAITLLYVGQIVRHKGLSILAQALKEVARDDLRLHVAGLGEYTAPLQREMRQIDNVTFHGYVSGAEKASLFQCSDAFILPSVCYDNAPLTVLEAYTYGLPVIGSRIGGIPELVLQGKTGYLFEPGDVRQLASILQNISKESLQRMAPACQEMVRNYSTAKHLDRLITIYSEVKQSGAQISKEYDPDLRQAMHFSEEWEK